MMQTPEFRVEHARFVRERFAMAKLALKRLDIEISDRIELRLNVEPEQLKYTVSVNHLPTDELIEERRRLQYELLNIMAHLSIAEAPLKYLRFDVVEIIDE